MKTFGYPYKLTVEDRPPQVLVIGGTSGIGEAICEWLSDGTTTDHPTTVVGTGVEDFQAQSVHWPYVLKRYGCPQHIVYCAGENYLDWLGSPNVGGLHEDQLRYKIMDVFATNVQGFILMLDAMVPMYCAAPANIVAISSDAAVRPLRTSIAYCASKAALDMAVKVAARELGPKGWRVNAVAPGMVEGTGMTKYIDRRVPFVRGWTPEEAIKYERSQEVTPGRVERWEVAQVVADVLYGPPHLNGAIIPVNGGR